MSALVDFIRKRFMPVKPLPSGLHHGLFAPPDKPPYRLHLRMQPDGSGILIVNAATVLRLNPSATEYAYHMLRGSSPQEAGKAIASRYRVSKKQAQQDFVNFVERIEALIDTPDLDPVSFLDFERVEPYSGALGAPLRLDCALTYRLPAGASAEDAPTKRVDRELTTDEWKFILDKAWVVGIPHVTFTGGEPTLREDLPELIAYAEAKGMVSGLLSNGLKLADQEYLRLLLQTGLDHLLFVLQPENPASWKALEVVMPEDIFVTVHLTVTRKNAAQAATYLDRLAELDVRSLSLTFEPGMDQAAPELRNHAAALGLTLTWDLPVPYSALHPVSLEAAEGEVRSGAGKAWLYVEPDGDVLPAQGMADHILGNFLRDPWEKIYQA
ncbi:MAG: radical SAM protein [Candidatus Villigracilaceae bacterium]